MVQHKQELFQAIAWRTLKGIKIIVAAELQ